MRSRRSLSLSADLQRVRLFGPAGWLCVALLAPALALAEPSSAADDAVFAPPPVSVLGALTLPAGEQALTVSAGLPDLEVGWLVGLSSLADVRPRLALQFGRGVRIGGGGTTLGATFRLQLAAFSGWHLALTSDPELTLHFFGVDHPPTADSTSTAFLLTPFSGGLVLDRALHEDVRLVISVQSAVGAFISPETALHVPVIAGVGGEFRLGDAVWLYTKLDSGADLYGLGSAAGSRAYLRARVGISLPR
jgi:hypothetical protein